MATFPFLSTLSGILELGIVFLSLSLTNGLLTWKLLMLPLAYQLGNLLFIPGVVSRKPALVVGTLALLSLLFRVPNYSLPQAMFWIFTASLCLQAARARKKADCPTWIKRSFRVLGFALSPFVVFMPRIMLAVCLLSALVALWSAPSETDKPEQKPALALKLIPTMISHQMHYFVYTYIIAAWFTVWSGNMVYGAIAFALTWLVYLSPQPLAEFADQHFKSHRVSHRALFFTCHSFLALVMAAMTFGAVFGSVRILCLAWLLTGLGGGSVFCIKHLTPELRQTDMTFSENVGHVLGVIVAVVLAIFCHSHELALLPTATGASCLFVCLTLISATLNIWANSMPSDLGKPENKLENNLKKGVECHV